MEHENQLLARALAAEPHRVSRSEEIVVQCEFDPAPEECFVSLSRIALNLQLWAQGFRV